MSSRANPTSSALLLGLLTACNANTGGPYDEPTSLYETGDSDGGALVAEGEVSDVAFDEGSDEGSADFNAEAAAAVCSHEGMICGTDRICSSGRCRKTNALRMGIAIGPPPAGVSASQRWDVAHAAGFRVARVGVNVGNYNNLGIIDDEIADARRVGMKIMALIAYAYNGLGRNGSQSEPRDPQAWANYAGRLVEHWQQTAPGVVIAVEVWNEANHTGFWNPVNPEGYANLLHRTYVAIKARTPGMHIVTTGMAPGAGNGSAASTTDPHNPATFLARIYQWNRNQGRTGSAGIFDAVGIHPYETRTPGVVNGAGSGHRITYHLRVLMNSKGDAAKKIWGTEAGLPSCWAMSGRIFTEAQRAMHLPLVFDDWWYGRHVASDGSTSATGATLDWNTGPYFVFRQFKPSEGAVGALGLHSYGVVYPSRAFMRANAPASSESVCRNPPADFWRPPVIAAAARYARTVQ